MTGRPLAGRSVWFFAAVPWDFALHGRTRWLALALRELGARITFVEPPSLKKSLRRLSAPPDNPPDLRVVAMPPSVPRYSDRLPIVPRLHDAAQNAWLRTMLAWTGERPAAIVSTPRWAPALEGLPLSPLIYDCLDELEVFAQPALLDSFRRWEKQLMARSDAVFSVTPALAESLKGRGARQVEVVANGVGVDGFLARSLPMEPKGHRRRIGYVGAIFEWVDVALLAAVARELSEHELYLVGPVRRGVDVSALEALPNVVMTGWRPYEDVPKAMASFDVALIPFKEGSVARAADPIKIYEYFCFGTPVVTTPVGDVERLANLAYVASGAEAFIRAVRGALIELRPDLRERRLAFARANDWSVRAEQVARVLSAPGGVPA